MLRSGSLGELWLARGSSNKVVWFSSLSDTAKPTVRVGELEGCRRGERAPLVTRIDWTCLGWSLCRLGIMFWFTFRPSGIRGLIFLEEYLFRWSLCCG